MSNLRLINETTASSVSALNVTDVFNANFDIYKITANVSFPTNEYYMELRFINSSGSVVSSSNYDSAGLNMFSNTSFSESKATSDTRARFLAYAGDTVAETNGAVFYVFNPFSSSSYTFIISQGGTQRTAGVLNMKAISVLKETTPITGFQIFGYNNEVMPSPTARTYGLRVDT